MNKKVKFLLSLFLTLIFISGCGKNNESGKNSSSSFFGSVGTYSGVAPANTNNPNVNLVFQILPCFTNGSSQRIGTGTAMNFRVAALASHVGVSAEGDVAVLTGDNVGNAVLSLYLCPRGITGSVSMQQNPAFGVSTAGCRVNPITAANVFTMGYNFPPISFFAIDTIGLPGLPPLPSQFYQLRQSLCN